MNGTTFQLKEGSTPIAAILSTSTKQVTLRPSAALKGSTIYTATIKGGPSGIKDLAHNALATDFSWSFTTVVVDNTAPTITTVSPVNGASGVSTGTTITANFSESINTATVTGTTVQLKNSSNGIIAATISASGSQIILTPLTVLANSSVYRVTITGGASGVKDLAGNALAINYTWTFTTAAASAITYSIFPTTTTPSEPSNNDGQGIVVGMKFRSSLNGYITGVRYYKGAGSTGIRTGHLWTSTGSLLGSTTFNGETASGWQQTLFAAPIAITANITYVVSLFSPSGDYVVTNPYFTQTLVNGPLRALSNGEDGLNGLYDYSSTSVFPTSSFDASNYWVDAVFTTSGPVTATVITTQPISQTTCAGTAVSFTCVATGTPAPTVQWQVTSNGISWANVIGATNATLSFVTTIADNNKRYRAVWKNSAGSAVSTPATLTVNASAPAVAVTNNCGNSVLTAIGFTGSLLWSNGETTPSITVATPGTYTVKQTINGCISAEGSGLASPQAMPVLSGSLSAIVTSGTAFTYTATSNMEGTAFAWSRAAVTGISNAAASGTGSINETLINTTGLPVNVTYAFSLTANGCTNTKNVVVTVNPAICTINSTSLASNFSATAIPAGRYIWFNSSFDPGPLGTGTDPVTIYVRNGVISFTANNVQYNLNVPNARIRFDAAVTSASTQFINNEWETVVPRNYSSDIFMGGLSYLVPVNFPGNYMNVTWTTNINVDKPGISVGWHWAAAVYTSFADHPGLNVKSINGITQNPYTNTDRASTPENFKSFVVDGARGTGGTNYTGSFSTVSTATCISNTSQRSSVQPIVKRIPASSVEDLLNEKLEINAKPNPSNTFFNLVIKGSNKSPVMVRVMDIFGRVVEKYEKISSNSVLKIGQQAGKRLLFC